MGKLLDLYAPSFLTRYSLQLMIVALPWLLQLRGADLQGIGNNFFFFSAGSLIAGLLYLLSVGRVNNTAVLQQSIALQAILSSACFFIESALWLNAIRFAQGALLGLLRPANQIWINEHRVGIPRVQLVKQSTFSQVVISIGMVCGGGVGSFVKTVSDSIEWAIIFGSAACLIPSAAIMLIVARASKGKNPSPDSFEAEKIQRAVTFVLKSPSVLSAIAIYAFSLAIFKVWIIAIPFMLREYPHRFSLSDASTFLFAFFILHPIVFSLAQFLVGRFVHWMPKGTTSVILLLAGATIGQAALVWISALQSNPVICMLLILLGGGAIAALVHPGLMTIIYREVPDQQGRLMRGVLTILSIAADAGQLWGALLLMGAQDSLASISRMGVPILGAAGCGVLYSIFAWRYQPSEQR